MMLNFCTLFDSYYLDKGIALYRSLEQVSDDFTLYIFCSFIITAYKDVPSLYPHTVRVSRKKYGFLWLVLIQK